MSEWPKLTLGQTNWSDFALSAICAILRLMSIKWDNPLTKFLTDAESVFLSIKAEPDIHSDPALTSKFVGIAERRRFIFDIFDRVESLATALFRLHELCEAYRQLDAARQRATSEQRLNDPQRLCFDVPDEVHSGINKCHREARVLVAFLYYELTTLVSLLRPWLTPSVGSHLEYLVGVRNKILAHPRRDGRVKQSSSTLAIGPILHAHLLGANSWIPLIRDWYLKELSVRLDDTAGTAANVALIRDGRRKTRDFKPEEILRLKAYDIPEPDLLGSAREMAGLLELNFLPEIEEACRATVK
jgi:hypothetical protein